MGVWVWGDWDGVMGRVVEGATWRVGEGGGKRHGAWGMEHGVRRRGGDLARGRVGNKKKRVRVGVRRGKVASVLEQGDVARFTGDVPDPL